MAYDKQEISLMTDEAWLIQQAQQDIRFFRELYPRYVDRIYAYIAYRVGTKQDVEDLVSETFLRALERIQDFEYRGEWSFGGWLLRIAYLVVNEHYRRHATHKTPLALEDVPMIESEHPHLDDQLILKELFVTLQHLLQTLAPRQQEVILLKYFGGLRNQEIATLLGMTESTIASYLSRALDTLEKKYQLETLTHEHA
jgi:RNA polymerase sigma-70 factor, ECF subfamily